MKYNDWQSLFSNVLIYPLPPFHTIRPHLDMPTPRFDSNRREVRLQEMFRSQISLDYVEGF